MVIHTVVINSDIAIPIAAVHELVPLTFSVLCRDPLAEGGNIVQRSIRFL